MANNTEVQRLYLTQSEVKCTICGVRFKSHFLVTLGKFCEVAEHPEKGCKNDNKYFILSTDTSMIEDMRY